MPEHVVQAVEATPVVARQHGVASVQVKNIGEGGMKPLLPGLLIPVLRVSSSGPKRRLNASCLSSLTRRSRDTRTAYSAIAYSIERIEPSGTGRVRSMSRNSATETGCSGAGFMVLIPPPPWLAPAQQSARCP